MLKDALPMLALHTLIGPIFTEDVRETDRNYPYSQTTTHQQPKLRTSPLEA